MNFLHAIPTKFIDPVAFNIGRDVRWYAVLILVGILVAFWAGIREGRKIGIFSDFIFYSVIIAVPLSIIGARIWYIIFNIDQFTRSGSFDFSLAIGAKDGLSGLAIQGGVITAIIYMIVATRKAHINTYKLFDIVAPGFLIGQIFGRWGNFFNHELYGKAVTNVDLFYKLLPDFIANNMYIQANDLPGITAGWYHPMFLYESMGNLLGLIIILVARRKFKKLKLGDLIGFYLIWYGIVRSITESFRNINETLLFKGTNIKVSIVMSIIFIIVGLGFLIIKRFKGPQDYYQDVMKEVEANKFDTVVFSFSGTLVNTDALIRHCAILATNKLLPSKSLTELEINRFLYEKPQDAFSKITDNEILQKELFKSYVSFYEENEAEKLKLVRGVRETLDLLKKRKYNITIVTKTNTTNLMSALEKLRLKKYFNIVYSYEDLINGDILSGVKKAQEEFNSKRILFVTSNYNDAKNIELPNVSTSLISENVKDLPQEEKDPVDFYLGSLPEIKRVLVE